MRHVSVRKLESLIARPPPKERLEQLANQPQLEGLVEGVVEQRAANDQLEGPSAHHGG